MSLSPSCPRCPAPVRPPGLWSSSWRCETHGDVLPLCVATLPGPQALARAIALARVPVWMPRPLPVGWLVTGVAWAGDERTGARGVAIALSGPSPTGGPGELVLVAEESGVGLGARLAGSADADPACCAGPPAFKVEAARHPTALWAQDTPADRAAFAGEARAVWLEAVFWPGQASLLLLEHLALVDLRDHPPAQLDLSFGARSPYLGSASTPAAADRVAGR